MTDVVWVYDLLGRNIKTGTAVYGYDVNGMRVTKKIGTGAVTKFVWDMGNIVWDNAEGTDSTWYLYGIGRVKSTSSTASMSYFYLYNAHGDVIILAHITTGAVSKNYTYDAFGVEKNEVSADKNLWRYCGEYYDKETGFYYLRARYYNPAVGRFTQQDPICDGLNWYTYCNNNPVSFRDPSGLAPTLYEDSVLSYEDWAYMEAVDYAMSSGRGWDSTYIDSIYSGYIASKPSNPKNAITSNTSVWILKPDSYTKEHDPLYLTNEALLSGQGISIFTQMKSILDADYALNSIYIFDQYIDAIGSIFSLPSDMIRAVLYREMMCVGIDDAIGDYIFAVGQKRESSTGIAQIKPTTAIEAEMNVFRYNTTTDIGVMWQILQDDVFNIYYCGMILRNEANGLGYGGRIGMFEYDKIQRVFSYYNGDSSYGKAVIKNYKEFLKG